MANVNVTYPQMQDAAARLRNGRVEIDDLLSRLKSQVDGLVADGYVTDASSKRFQASYDEFTTGARTAIAGLEGMSSHLTTAAQAFQDADTQLASALGR